jgi:hypothetical protein
MARRDDYRLRRVGRRGQSVGRMVATMLVWWIGAAGWISAHALTFAVLAHTRGGDRQWSDPNKVGSTG